MFVLGFVSSFFLVPKHAPIPVDGQNPKTTKDDDYPMIYRVLTIPGGCLGFCPSTVWMVLSFLHKVGHTEPILIKWSEKIGPYKYSRK